MLPDQAIDPVLAAAAALLTLNAKHIELADDIAEKESAVLRHDGGAYSSPSGHSDKDGYINGPNAGADRELVGMGVEKTERPGDS